VNTLEDLKMKRPSVDLAEIRREYREAAEREKARNRREA
jgi:hypothetical protein